MMHMVNLAICSRTKPLPRRLKSSSCLERWPATSCRSRCWVSFMSYIGVEKYARMRCCLFGTSRTKIVSARICTRIDLQHAKHSQNLVRAGYKGGKLSSCPRAFNRQPHQHPQRQSTEGKFHSSHLDLYILQSIKINIDILSYYNNC